MEDKIQSELKAVQKKLEDIEKKQAMLNKIQQLDRQHQKMMGEIYANVIDVESMTQGNIFLSINDKKIFK